MRTAPQQIVRSERGSTGILAREGAESEKITKARLPLSAAKQTQLISARSRADKYTTVVMVVFLFLSPPVLIMRLGIICAALAGEARARQDNSLDLRSLRPCSAWPPWRQQQLSSRLHRKLIRNRGHKGADSRLCFVILVRDVFVSCCCICRGCCSLTRACVCDLCCCHRPALRPRHHTASSGSVFVRAARRDEQEVRRTDRRTEIGPWTIWVSARANEPSAPFGAT